MPTPLIDPPGRQGPGRVGGPAVQAIELALARRTGGVLPGEHRAAGLGSGTELSQLRPYVEGDDVRHLDPAASARTGEPHVRVHVPERTVTTWIALDVSASMAFGTRDRLKSDVAEGVARVVSRVGVRRGGRIALFRWGAGAGATRLVPPAGGRGALGTVDRALAEGVAPDGTADAEDLATALGRLTRIARRPGIVTVVSDLRDGSAWERPLSVLARQHRVLVIEVVDPRELALPDAGTLLLVDPETGEDVEVDTSSRRLREAFARAESERREGVRAAVRRTRSGFLTVTTDGDWLRELGRGLA
ncbi:DUF58 domain-containing protein [Patulibacter sp. SYSU D01012]|uniref:DUF58 domain-containing protein n=1 Tax=Patulibacter sp. SYSU D01012 TaxID=2817381 RepID=UPI001B314BCD